MISIQEARLSILIAAIAGFAFGTFSTEDRYEKGLLRFCMTHNIPLEQCKIPDEGE